MKKERQFLCFLIVMYPLKISCLLYALLTDYWVETDDFHFGLYKYCVDNTSTCLDVTIQLQTIEDHILVTKYSLIIACILVFVCLVFCVSLCSECSDWLKKKKMHARVNVTGAFFQFLLEACTVFTFVLGVTDHDLLRVSQLSWSFYIASSTMCFTFLFLFVLLHNTLYCNRNSCLTTVVDSSGTKLNFQTPPQSVSVDAGNTVSIVAYVRNANRVYWCQGRDPVVRISTSFEERFNNSHKAELTLKNARLEDNGEYTCVAEKYGKNRKEIRESFFIYVHRVKPVFYTKPKDLTVHVGETLNLEANVKNAEAISWFHEDQILINSKNKITLKFVNEKASLKIDCVTKNDEGDYTCLAKSGIDPIKAKEESVYCHVRVIDAELPSFNNVPNSLNIKSGLTLEIAINVCGYPKPKNVCWFKDGKVIERSRSVIMQYMEGDCRLLIHDTVQADSGMYECYAENAHGNNRCKIPVKVTKDDQEPISCTQVLIGVIEG
uniref:Ig-like domain-containing protein n=1 Tax=Magallana gigas TaxID=29159 RepID=A0A8W8NKX6_MAGGI|nr:peroxidasin homolog isoform X1 [Crassostrea gigas]